MFWNANIAQACLWIDDFTPGYRLILLSRHTFDEAQWACPRRQTELCVYRVHCGMGCILISSDRRGGRCWQRLEDRWWWVVGLRMGRIGGWVAGQISSLLLWRRNKLNWQWQMNHLLFPNCQFYAFQIPFSLSDSFLFPHHFLHEHPQPLSSSLSYTKFFFSASLSPFLHFFTFGLFSPWCHFTSLPPRITFLYSHFCSVAVKVLLIFVFEEVLLHSVIAYLVNLVA